MSDGAVQLAPVALRAAQIAPSLHDRVGAYADLRTGSLDTENNCFFDVSSLLVCRGIEGVGDGSRSIKAYD
jgi:hypothetical protein